MDGRPLLVATDLDGTLLRSDGTVSARTSAALRALDAQGVPVLFVTARPIRWVEELAGHVGEHGRVICSNGAVLLDLQRGGIEVARTMSAAAALAAVAAIRASVPAVTFALEGLSGFAKEPGFLERAPAPPGSAVGAVEDLVLEDDVLKLMVRHETLAPDEFRHRVSTVVHGPEVTASDGSGLLELSAAGVTKAGMLALVCERMSIAAADVVAFGDMPNDVPMLAWAGRSFAVAGAHPSATAIATDVTSSNDDDGVAVVLEALFGL